MDRISHLFNKKRRRIRDIYKTLMMISVLNVVHTSQNFNLAIYFTLKIRKLAEKKNLVI